MYELTKDNKLLSHNYTYFNLAILIAAQDTATKARTKNQGWFHHSEIILFAVIQHRDHLLHHLISTDPSENTTVIKEGLKAAQNVVNEQVSLAKASWSAHQAKIIHSMLFTPREAWTSVKILAGVTMSHHEKPTVMRLRLTNGELATNDAKNVPVMGPHL